MSRLIEELRAIVGDENATDDIAICASYSRDQHWHFVPAKNPAYVVRPCSKEEVRQILMLANREKIPVIPYSTGINVRGLTIPVHDGEVQCGDNRADDGTNAISMRRYKFNFLYSSSLPVFPLYLELLVIRSCP